MGYVDNEPLLSNLIRLQKEAKYTNRKISELTGGGVSDRFVANVKNNDNSPSLEIIRALARAFKLEPWQLLLPDMANKTEMIYDKSYRNDKNLREIIDNYLASDEKGRELIWLIASTQAKNN